MAALSAGKIAEVMFEDVMEAIEDQTMLADMCERFEPGSGNMQNANNFVWRPVEQQAVIQEGWDMTGLETDIIEETYPSVLGTPNDDFVEQRADDMRDLEFWRRRGRRSAKQMAVNQNTTIANAIMNQGSLYYESAATDGFDFVADAQVLLNEQQRTQTQRHMILNDRVTKKYASDLAGRQTLQGRPESDAWAQGQIGQNVAEFNIHTASFLPTFETASGADSTVSGNQSFAPEGGSVNPVSGEVQNVDYRVATIPVVDSAGYKVGDKIEFDNGGAKVMAVGSSDKLNTLTPRTFTVVDVPSATTVTVFPKPIALDDPALTVIQKAYANVNTRILNGANMVKVNTAATSKSNLFFDQDAVEIISGQIPADLFAEYNGHKVISATMKNGHPMYMIYDANMVNMNFRYRLFSWWGVTIKDPMRCGTAIAV